jgi:hypothetical protein
MQDLDVEGDPEEVSFPIVPEGRRYWTDDRGGQFDPPPRPEPIQSEAYVRAAISVPRALWWPLILHVYVARGWEPGRYRHVPDELLAGLLPLPWWEDLRGGRVV